MNPDALLQRDTLFQRVADVTREPAEELRRDEAWQVSQLKIFSHTASHFLPPTA